MPLPPPAYIKKSSIILHKEQTFDSIGLAKRLSELGYLRVPKVGMKGEFALRGEVLDIFMPGEMYANRIVFDFDKIEQIKVFDTENQASISTVDRLLIYPMKEVLWNEELIKLLNNRLCNIDTQDSVGEGFESKELEDIFANESLFSLKDVIRLQSYQVSMPFWARNYFTVVCGISIIQFLIIFQKIQLSSIWIMIDFLMEINC